MIKRDERLSLPEKELDDLCAYLHHIICATKQIAGRNKLVEAFSSFTDNDIYDIVDSWCIWLKKMIHRKKLTSSALEALSDILFLEYKKLSTDKKEDRYLLYLKNKYSKQLERPEHKLYTSIRIMKSLSLPYPSNHLLDKLL